VARKAAPNLFFVFFKMVQMIFSPPRRGGEKKARYGEAYLSDRLFVDRTFRRFGVFVAGVLRVTNL
jgi:hypothetical protein